MGASSSTRRSARSTAEDVVPNLERSLEALMAWEDRAPRVKQVVTGPVVRPRQGTDVAAVGLDALDLDGVYAVLAELERIVGEAAGGGAPAAGGKKAKKDKAATAYTGTAFKTGSLFPSGAGRGSGGPTTTTSAPAIFGATPRADEEKQSAAAAADTRRLAVMADITTELQPASALFRRAALSSVGEEQEGGAHGAQPARKEEEGSGVEGVERKSAGLVEHEVEEKDEKVEVAAKYLFVHRWLQKLLQAAEHCVKLRSRLSAYSKQLKPKRADELSEMDKLRLHRQHEQCSKALQSALLNWDKANVAAGWLERDFDLVYAQLVAHSALHTMLHTRDDIKARLVIQPSEELKKHQAIADQLVCELELAAHRVAAERQQHELDALSVGLSYFDREGKGAITAAECPELSARLFDLLDANKDGAISHDDLNKSVTQLIAALDKAVERIRQLHREVDDLREKRSVGQAADNLSVQIAQNEATIEELKRDVQEKQKDLRAIFNYFHTAFALHVFGLVGERGRERRVRLRELLGELERVEAAANTDPLQVDEAALRATRPELVAPGSSGGWTQQTSQQPQQPMAATQPTQPIEPREAGIRMAAQQQQQQPQTYGGAEPALVQSRRWTESEKEAERGSSKGSALESITGKLKQWTGAGGEERHTTTAGADIGTDLGTASSGLASAGAGEERAGTGAVGGASEGSGASAGMGETLSGVKSTLGAAGHAVSEAASGIQEKVSETFGDFKSKTFSR